MIFECDQSSFNTVPFIYASVGDLEVTAELAEAIATTVSDNGLPINAGTLKDFDKLAAMALSAWLAIDHGRSRLTMVEAAAAQRLMGRIAGWAQ